ncbi:MAG: acetylglutamate kinase [Bdellovibrionales bacterium]|nr:acetylglutamate kinase [Bdellovibrionales bacterium]
MTEVDIQLLKTAVPYIRAYKGETFVIKLGGEICKPGRHLKNLVEQFSLLYQLGIRLVIVHGGGPQANALAEKLNVEPEFINGRRITSPEMLEVAKMSFAGTVNTDLVAALNAEVVPAVGISGIDGGLAIATKRPKKTVRSAETGKEVEVDFGEVADLDSIQPDVLNHLLDCGHVPVVCSLVADENGKILNINADTLAAYIAEAVSAKKYCLLSQVDGVMRDLNDPTTLYSELTISEAKELLTDGTIQGGMHPKIENCIEVLQRGVPRAHISNGLKPDAFLREIFTNEGCGTLIVSKRS